jgi:4-hydroxybenzoate polyprenyltransferase
MSRMPSLSEAWRRLWQPRHPLFWLMLALQLLSSVLVLIIQIQDPPAGLRLVLGLLALSNSLLSWWLLARLWRETGTDAVEAHR